MCVDRFKAAADSPAQLVALKALGGWDRGSFVEKGGWAAMPDKIDPGEGAARLCADKLAALEGPTAAVNSFTYLQTAFPSAYPTPLVPAG